MYKKEIVEKDTWIIESLQQNSNSNEAIGFLYTEYFEFLGRFVMNNNGSWDDAQDIFQETLISFVNLVQQKKFRGDASIKTFLYSLNRNIWLNELKRRGRALKRETKYETETERKDKNIIAVLETREHVKTLMQLLDETGENCKKILLLYYYENLSMKEIVEQMHYENDQVIRNKKYKCLKKLEELISADPLLAKQLKSFLND